MGATGITTLAAVKGHVVLVTCSYTVVLSYLQLLFGVLQ